VNVSASAKGPGIPRTDIETVFTSISLTHKDCEARAAKTPVIRVLPECNVVKIGGQSIMDRGKAVVYPLIEEIVEAKKKHKILLGMGGGTRARHAYAIALDLGMPTGVLARIGASVPRQNARMMQMLLAKHGGIMINFEEFDKLPLYFRLDCIPIIIGMPPNDYWEKPEATGRIPANRTDSGVYLGAEFLGARTCVMVKDEKGLFTADPKKDKNAKFIGRIHAKELLAMELGDLIVERTVVQNLIHAKCVKQVQIVNGLERGNLLKALDGEHVGTIIYAD
jgi:molybdenum storage protein